MSEWKSGRIADIADIITGFPFKSDEYEFTGSLRVVRGENVTIGSLRWDSEKFWNKSIEDLEKYLLNEGDFVIGMDGSRVGKNRSSIRTNELPLILAQRVARIRAKSNYSQKFINYLFLSKDFEEYVTAIHTGTSIPHISQKQISEFEIFYPDDFFIQQSIAEVLSSLDDKIDLLHRQNKTLEQMAETLFRQWFVESVDISWNEMSLYDAIELIGGGTPKTDNNEYWNGDICWLSGGDIADGHKGFVLTTEKKITEAGLNNSSTKLIPKNCTVITARGTVGKYCLLSKPMTFSQSNYGIKPRFDNCYFFTYLLISYSVEELEAAAYGTVFDTITTSTFKDHKVKLPDTIKIQHFELTVAPLFEKMLNNSSQVSKLVDIRDALLPKLMNGSIRVINN